MFFLYALTSEICTITRVTFFVKVVKRKSFTASYIQQDIPKFVELSLKKEIKNFVLEM